jgi:hypothetical protein
MPMVVMKDGVNESSLKRSKQHDLPTPESPMRRSLIFREVSSVLCKGRGCRKSARRASAQVEAQRQAYKEIVIPGASHVWYMTAVKVVEGGVCGEVPA